MSDTTPDAVIAFWTDAGPARWFAHDPAFDSQCRERFLDAHMDASRNGLDAWADDARGALALCLLLDQMPRNIFRDSAHAFATDPLALRIATRAVERGFDGELDVDLRRFLYLPFEHDESIAAQDRSVELHRSTGVDGYDEWAVHHRDIIERFGRFPHRNRVLGRETTPQEQAYLDGGGFGG